VVEKYKMIIPLVTTGGIFIIGVCLLIKRQSLDYAKQIGAGL